MNELVINEICGTQLGYRTGSRISVASTFNIKVFDFGQRISYVKGGLWKLDQK